MRLPYMTAQANRAKQQIIAFGGVNYGLRPNDGELSESLGLSSARYPCLSQRAGRKTFGSYTDPTGLYARGKLCVVDGTDFIYDGKVVGQVLAGEKLFATINTKIVIFPDKVYYDTKEEKFGNLSAKCPGYAGDITFTANTLTVPEQSWNDVAREEDTTHAGVPGDTAITAYTGASVDKTTGALTLTGNTEKTAATLKKGDIIQYGIEEADQTKQYLIVKSCEKEEAPEETPPEKAQAEGEDGGDTPEETANYTIIGTLHEATLYQYPDLTELFKKGDGVEISGCTSFPKNNGTRVVKDTAKRTLTFADHTFDAGKEEGTVMIERKVPDFTCICECDNRIWGGEGTTIYASALGDPTNFYVFDGLATDSYSVAVGSDGDFTGCCAYSSTVLFWKENYLHKILGSYPAQYEVYTYTVPGIQKGSEKSLVVINETLFYKGRNGVYAYSGGTPELISENFGTRRFQNGIGGTDGERYYLSMQREDKEWELYVFDTIRGLWLREDAIHAVDFAYLDGTLYFLDGSNKKVLMMGQDTSEEGPVEWSATLCQFDETTQGRKRYSRLYLRTDMEAGSWLKIEVSVDNAPFRQVFATHNQRAKTMNIPILPVRCDNFQVRLSGKGVCVIKSIVREFDLGSEF